MNLKIGSVYNYNNMFQGSADDIKIGINNTLNDSSKVKTDVLTNDKSNDLMNK